VSEYTLFFIFFSLYISSKAAPRLSLFVYFAASAASNNSCVFPSLTRATSKSFFSVDIEHLKSDAA